MKLFLTLLSSVFLLAQAFGAETLSYSGRLANADGSPVSGPVDLRFQMVYTGSTGTVRCSTTVNGVSLSNGVFHVKLEVPSTDCSGSTLTQILLGIPAGQALAIRVTDLTNSPGSPYDYQAIHATPYSLMAEMAKTLAPPTAATPGQVLKWNGTAWVAADDDTGSGGTTSAITNTAGNITLTPNMGAGSVVINATTVSATYTSGAVVVNGGVGVAGNINSDGSISSNASVAAPLINAGTSVTTPQIYGSSAAGGDLLIDGTSNATKGDILMATAGIGGRVGIGTASPDVPLHVKGPSAPPSASAAAAILEVHGSSTQTLAIGADNTLPYSIWLQTTRHNPGYDGSTYPLVLNPLGGNVGIGALDPGSVLDVRQLQPTRTRMSLSNLQTAASGSRSVSINLNGYDAGGTTLVNKFEIGTDLGLNSTNDFYIFDNVANAMRFYIAQSGNISLGPSSNPTAALHIKAGTSAAGTAPLKLTAGTNLTTPEAGAIEFDGTNLFFTNSANARQTLLSSGGGALTSVSSIANSSGNISLSAVPTTGAVVIDSGTTSISSTSGALQVTGGIGVTNNIFTGGSVNVGTNLNVGTSGFIPQLYGSSSAGGDILIDGSSNATKGDVLLATTGGKVGVGTSSPSAHLDVLANPGTGTDNLFRAGALFGPTTFGIMNLSGGAGWGSLIYSYGCDNSNAGACAGNGAGGALYFSAGQSGTTPREPTHTQVENAVKMTISATGNVGIGTTSPQTKLSISGTNEVLTLENGSAAAGSGSTIRFGHNQDGSQAPVAEIASYLTDGSVAGRAGQLRLRTAITGTMTDRLVIDQLGNVGIGTDGPTAKLQVNNTTTFNPASNVQGAISLDGNYGGGLVFEDTAYAGIWAADNGQSLNFSSNGSVAGFGNGVYGQMVLKNGHLGIGIEDPVYPLEIDGQAKLHAAYVQGPTATSGNIVMQANAGAGIAWWLSANPAFFRIGGNGGTEPAIGAINVDFNGDVGVGVESTGYKLEVAGDLNATGTVSAAGVALTSDLRLKEKLAPLKGSLQKLSRLKAYSYFWKDKQKFNADKQIGLVAQEVQKVFPEAVTKKKDGYLALSYGQLVAPLIHALQELHQKFFGLDEEVKNLREENEMLKAYLCEQDPRAKFCSR